MLGGPVRRVVHAVISSGLAAVVALSGVSVASPAAQAAALSPWGSDSSSAVGSLESLTLPAAAVAGDGLPMQVAIRCEGDQQAVLVRMRLTFENEQGITTNVTVDKAGIEAVATEGAVTTYRV